MRYCDLGFRTCGEHETTRHRIFGGQAGIGHEKSRKSLARPEFVQSCIAGRVRAIRLSIARLHRILNGECDADLDGHGPGIRHAIAQNRNRQARIVSIVWDEGRKRFEFHFHWQRLIMKIDVRHWILPCKGRGFQPAQTRSIVRTEPA